VPVTGGTWLGRQIVLTAGTGAGKTEAFLLPMLNAIFRDPRKTGQTGVQAIILYQ
jgi:DEAD/DEAH box helicase domain-containing protein